MFLDMDSFSLAASVLFDFFLLYYIIVDSGAIVVGTESVVMSRSGDNVHVLIGYDWIHIVTVGLIVPYRTCETA